MGYSLDLNAISLSAYLHLLKAQTLLPGRRMLQEHADERFALLMQLGLSTLAQLKAALAEAQSAKAREDWAAVVAAADKALKLDDGNAEAKRLKAEAEGKLEPTLTILAIAWRATDYLVEQMKRGDV